MTQYVPKFRKPKPSPLSRIAGPVSIVLTLVLLLILLTQLGGSGQGTVVKISVPDIPEEFGALLSHHESFLPQVQQTQKKPAAPIKKLNDSDLVAPVPLAENYGQAETVAEMDWFAEEAADLLQGQALYFGPEREHLEGTPIKYYLDDSIAVVT